MGHGQSLCCGMKNATPLEDRRNMRTGILKTQVIVILLYIFIYVIFLIRETLAYSRARDGKTFDFIIKSSFKKNKKIWGTYKLFKEKTIITSEVEKLLLQDIVKNSGLSGSSLVFRKGKVVFVEPNFLNGKTKLSVKSFPYVEDENKISIFSSHDAQKNHLLELYNDRLVKIFKKAQVLSKKRALIDNKRITFGKIDCLKNGNNIDCELPVSVR